MQQYEFQDPNRPLMLEWVNQTILHPVAALAMVLAALVFLVGGRKIWFLSMGLVICLLSEAQRFLIAGLDFQVLRFVGISGVALLAFRGEFKGLKISKLDWFLCAYFVLPAFFAALRGQTQSVLNHFGYAVDALSMYAIGRVAIRDFGDVRAFARSLVVISIPVVIAMCIEKMTARNFFSILGGVPEITPIRFGKLRAQGAFAHSIIAGVWFASSIPIICALWPVGHGTRGSVFFVLLGVSLAVFGVFATASSTPMAGLVLAGVAIGAYKIWPLIRASRVLIVIFLTAAHFASAAGIHHLLYTRFSFVTGSTGHHRFLLVDAAINNIKSWFLFGTNGTYSWGRGLWDVTQEYVAAAVNGGIIGLGLLITILVYCFKNAGKVMRRSEPNASFVGYCLGASIFVHATCFLGATYFGQIYLLLYFTIGGLQTLSVSGDLRSSDSSRRPERPEQMRRVARS